MTGTHGTPAERLNRRLVRMPNGCLEWTGYTNADGYGTIYVSGQHVKTHRLAWTLEHGPIPPGLDVLHHCDDPPCCDAVDTEHHLFLGTNADNNIDRDTKGRNGHANKAHCPADHLYDEANTYTSRQGKRGCRKCRAQATARYRAKNRRVSA